MTNNNDVNANATKHFLADYDDLPNLAQELLRRIEGFVEVVAPNPFRPDLDQIDENGVYTGETPHEVLVTTWKHYNAEGVLKQPQFFRRLHGALDDMANKLITNKRFHPWEMRNKPATTIGRAYHDYRHHVWPTAPSDDPLPVDVRLIIEYGPIHLDVDEVSPITAGMSLYGLKFHLVTLLERGSYGS